MSDEDAAVQDALWKLHQEHWELVRHHENQRSTVAGAMTAIAAGLTGLATFDDSLSLIDVPLTFLLMCIGLFGAVFSAKQWERGALHASRARAYRDAAIKLIGGQLIVSVKEQVDLDHNAEFPYLHKRRIHIFWIGVYLLLAALGLTLTTIALYQS